MYIYIYIFVYWLIYILTYSYMCLCACDGSSSPKRKILRLAPSGCNQMCCSVIWGKKWSVTSGSWIVHIIFGQHQLVLHHVQQVPRSEDDDATNFSTLCRAVSAASRRTSWWCHEIWSILKHYENMVSIWMQGSFWSNLNPRFGRYRPRLTLMRQLMEVSWKSQARTIEAWQGNHGQSTTWVRSENCFSCSFPAKRNAWGCFRAFFVFQVLVEFCVFSAMPMLPKFLEHFAAQEATQLWYVHHWRAQECLTIFSFDVSSAQTPPGRKCNETERQDWICI